MAARTARWVGGGAAWLALGLLGGTAGAQQAAAPPPSYSYVNPLNRGGNPYTTPIANPFMNPYLNPYLNPALTNGDIKADQSMLYLMELNKAQGGFGTGQLGPKAAQAQAKAGQAAGAARMPRTMAQPAVGAEPFYGRAPAARRPAAEYFDRGDVPQLPNRFNRSGPALPPAGGVVHPASARRPVVESPGVAAPEAAGEPAAVRGSWSGSSQFGQSYRR